MKDDFYTQIDFEATEKGVRTALKVIRDKRLYRAQCKTFEDYCQERFGIGRNYVNRRLVFAGIIENLVPRGTKPFQQLNVKRVR